MKKRILCFCLCLYCIGLWAANASFKKTGNDLLFLLPQGNVKLEFCTDDMFRVRHSQGTVFAENEQWMVRKYDFTPVHYTVEDKGVAWLITTGKLIIEATKNPYKNVVPQVPYKAVCRFYQKQTDRTDSW